MGGVSYSKMPQQKISMYDEPPQNTITLYEFNSIALDRLQLLRKIEFMYDSNEQDAQIAAEVNKYAVKHKLAIEGQYMRKGTSVVYEPLAAAKYQLFKNNDNISHFICRLAYCRNEELRKWFLTQETRLFNLRL